MDNCKCGRFTCDSYLGIIYLPTLSVLSVLGILVGGVINGHSFHHIYGIVYQVLRRTHSFH